MIYVNAQNESGASPARAVFRAWRSHDRLRPFFPRSRGAIFRRWRKLPTTRMRRRNPRGAASPSPRAIRPSIPRRIPRKPTRAKASRPDLPPTDPALAELLNPGIGQGTAGPGSQTGLQPPPDNSFDRRADFSAAHRARKSTASGIRRGAAVGLCRQGTAADAAPAGVDSELAQALGFEADDAADTGAADKNAITAFRGITGASATVQALETLLREGRPNSASGRGRRTARRGRKNPRAAGAGDQVGLRAQGRPAAGDRRPGGGRAPRRTAPRCCSASPAPARPSPWPR